MLLSGMADGVGKLFDDVFHGGLALTNLRLPYILDNLCIFLSVMVSYHHTKQRKLEPNLKARPCDVDQALCFTFRQHRH